MMDSFELTKISGALLTAVLLVVAPKALSDMIGGGHGQSHGPALAGYAMPIPSAGDAKAVAGGAAPAAAAFDPAAVVKLLAAAKPENGEGVFKRCASCHSSAKGAKSASGPNLWGLVGRKKGTQADFGGYSDAIKTKGGDWTFADLAAFLHNSKEWMPGTKMNINVSDAAELADLLAYLRTLSDAPAALP